MKAFKIIFFIILSFGLIYLGKKAIVKDGENRAVEYKQKQAEIQQAQPKPKITPELTTGRMWLHPSTETTNLTWYKADGLISIWLGYDWFFTDKSPKNKIFIYVDGDIDHYRIATPKHRNFNIGRPKSIAFRYEGEKAAFVDVYSHPKPRNVGVFDPQEIPHY